MTPENPTSISELGFDAVWVHSGYFDIIQQHLALGRGHHGGGDWAEGWNLPRLRTAMCMHYGFEQPYQCIKYLLGSHDQVCVVLFEFELRGRREGQPQGEASRDARGVASRLQVGCQHGGKHYEDYKMIGGRHRYACDQLGGGRDDPHARASALLWHTANVAAAGTPMLFMGTEWAQTGWWDVTGERRLNWELAADAIGAPMVAGFSAANALRRELPALRLGWPQMLHEDRPNGVMAFERVAPGHARVVVVVNAGRGAWLDGQYGAYVGGGDFEEVFASCDGRWGVHPGGAAASVTNAGRGVLRAHDGKLYINLPGQTTLVFKQVYDAQ